MAFDPCGQGTRDATVQLPQSRNAPQGHEGRILDGGSVVTTTYSGVTDLEVIDRMVTLLQKGEVVTVKLTRVLGGHISSGIWDVEVTHGG